MFDPKLDFCVDHCLGSGSYCSKRDSCSDFLEGDAVGAFIGKCLPEAVRGTGECPECSDDNWNENVAAAGFNAVFV